LPGPYDSHPPTQLVFGNYPLESRNDVWHPEYRAAEVRLKEFRMTVIVAFREDSDSILLAADSGGKESPGEIRLYGQQKLQKHPTAKLVWAVAGNAGLVGQDFTAWLKNMDCSNLEWEPFRDRAAEKLSCLNGFQKHLIEKSGSSVGEEDLGAVLLTGWLGNPERPAILELTEGGQATFYADEGFHSIGSGKPHAYIAHATLTPINIEPLQRLRHIATIATKMAQKSELPISIWRITKDAIEEGVESYGGQKEEAV
jgi:ATP-dependent protease HslVU (ClpYQ) peptidase subunit